MWWVKEDGGEGREDEAEGCPVWDGGKVSSHDATPVAIHHNYHRGSLTAVEIMRAVAGHRCVLGGSRQGQVNYRN